MDSHLHNSSIYLLIFNDAYNYFLDNKFREICISKNNYTEKTNNLYDLH